ncbi:MAG TPA: UDP-N-acetylmuramoyl-tripeptide--D-alanyl-D-alanine ligase, partial [Bdellovibrionota bacterium]|nr:UDP-N-acetylmuramoyl-tripeptide--D-alanyl-D-alanine ligase [Bdellovibrionota bacterium]
GDLARFHRRKWAKKIVAISGSNGKTTTKEIAAALLGASYSALKAPGTWNNALGVPLSLLMLEKKHDVAVLEMGMNDFGELAMLGRMAEHDAAILTNVGPVHLEKLGSVEGVARAKGELFTSLKEGGTAVVNQDDGWIAKLASTVSGRRVTVSLAAGADVSARVLQDLGSEGFHLAVQYGGQKTEIRFPFVGIHNVYNLLCALGAALALEVPVSRLQKGVDAIVRPSMRLETIECGRGIRLINDCYNANPSSTLVALEVVRDTSPKRKLAVLGDMMELGEFAPRAHRDIGIKVATFGFAHLFVLGQFSGDLVQGAVQGGMPRQNITVGKSHEDLAKAISENAKEGDTILVKGSRGMKMEKVTNELLRLWREKGA